ncbi:MAG: hypothetical protein GY697_11795, partial [Desulfobacterales bacterium]|nr:hypothetical protein [Desulfobacterales bacterium]
MHSNQFMTTILAIALGLLLVLTGYAGDAESVADENDFVALTAPPEGWVTLESPRTAAGNQLFTVINGGAELYVRLGFTRAVFASYRSPAGKSINLEIYQMKTPALARKVYTRKVGPGGRAMDFGEAALFEDYYLNFYRGSYQVTVSGYGTDKQTAAGIY